VIDTHCHLDVAAFDADRDEVIARAGAAGVRGMLIPAIRPRTWAALAALAERHAAAGVRFAIGIHPQIVPELDAEELGDARAGDLEERLARESEGAIAIGECGLDGGTGAPALQERIFRAHVRVARALGLPLVVHVLRAHDAAPRILREERAADVVLHSYSGGAALVPVYAALGCAFSFAGPVTYPNARRPIEAARAVPTELLLAETDAPDQAPTPQRSPAPASLDPPPGGAAGPARHGRRSEPGFLPSVIAGLAAARGADPAEVAALTAANAERLFRGFGPAIMRR
jgi:TatD DNase family protein